MLRIVALSLVNYALWSPVLLWLAFRAAPVGLSRYAQAHALPLVVLVIGVVLVAPVAEGLLIGRLRRSERLTRFLARTLAFRVQEIPKSWDYVFSRNRYYLVLVTLTDGSKIAGGWGSKSFASSYPIKGMRDND